MNVPPLIRSLRWAVQPTRCAWRQVMRPVTVRWNSSVAATIPEPAKPENSTDVTVPAGDGPRLPRAVQALYLRPLRHECEYGVPSADLQLRSYSLRGLEFFSDFALRAAYYLGLPAFGPVPLPRITERWTVPTSHFVHKKSQENYQRITLRRLIQIRDGHPESVQLWLAFLQKHAYPGVGMKANVWEYSKLDVGKQMDALADEIATAVEPQWERLAEGRVTAKMEEVLAEAGEPDAATVQQIQELLASERVKLSGGR